MWALTALGTWFPIASARARELLFLLFLFVQPHLPPLERLPDFLLLLLLLLLLLHLHLLLLLQLLGEHNT